jgi:DNA-binding MarR family transcriptional regulator
MELDRLAQCLGAFSTLEPIHFPLHHAQMFLEVARKENSTYAELEDALGLTNGSVSRSVTALSETNRHGEKGYQLVEVKRDENQRRRFVVSLTKKGHALKRQLEKI